MSIVEISSKDSVDAKLGNTINHCKFTVKLPKPLKDIVACQLLSASIPFSWHIINDSCNTFSLTKTTGNTNITIPEGTYSGHQLAEELTDLMSVGAHNITCTYDTTTDKINWSSASGFTIHFSTMNNQLRKILGCNYNSDLTGTSIDSNEAPQLTGDNTINLSVPNLFLDVQSSSNISSSTIQIPVTANPRGVILYVSESNSDVIGYQIESDVDEIKIHMSYFDGSDIGGSKNLRGIPCYFKFKFFHKSQ